MGPCVQNLTDDSVSEWFSWAGGSARACLKINKECGSAGLAAWTSDISNLLGKTSTDGLLVRTWPCRLMAAQMLTLFELSLVRQH